MPPTESVRLSNYTISREAKPAGTYIMSRGDMTASSNFQGVWVRFMQVCAQLQNGEVESTMGELDDCNRRLRLLSQAITALGELDALAGKSDKPLKDIDAIKKKYVGPDGKFSIDVLQEKIDSINKLLLDAGVQADPLFASNDTYRFGDWTDRQVNLISVDKALGFAGYADATLNKAPWTVLVSGEKNMKPYLGSVTDEQAKATEEKTKAIVREYFMKAVGGDVTKPLPANFVADTAKDLADKKDLSPEERRSLEIQLSVAAIGFQNYRTEYLTQREGWRNGPGLANALTAETTGLKLNSGISYINGAIDELKNKQQKLNTELSNLTQRLNTLLDSARSAVAKMDETFQKVVRDF